ncbi:hypothetical protein [Streptosporangium sp. CA-115845]|uniref:hypothetical protein n=1 Tax=Streptosporangium sp. CA-115845 TaxID=3240071 RepID=UPI003D930D30
MTTSSAAAVADPVGVLAVGGGVNKCYGEYFTNRWSSTCDKASKSGNYYTVATCANVGAMYGVSVYVNQYSSLSGFSEGTCYPERVQYASTAVWY